MEMALRTSNLVLPEGFVEMDCEEMMYVDGGGLYISYDAIYGLVTACGAVGYSCGINYMGQSIGAALWANKGLIASKIVAFFSWIWGIPFIGPPLAIWLGANALIAAVAFIDAFIKRKGVDFTYSWFTIKYSLK